MVLSVLTPTSSPFCQKHAPYQKDAFEFLRADSLSFHVPSIQHHVGLWSAPGKCLLSEWPQVGAEEDRAGWFGMILKVTPVWLCAEAMEDNRGSLMEAWGDGSCVAERLRACSRLARGACACPHNGRSSVWGPCGGCCEHVAKCDQFVEPPVREAQFSIN